MSINSKKKGNRGELELVKIFNTHFGEGLFSRTPSSGAITGGKNREITENLSLETKITLASDIITPIDFRFIIEHKFYAEPSFWDLFNSGAEINDWFTQAQNDADFVYKDPMVVVKYNRKPRIVYIKEKLDYEVFKFKNWYCYLLSDLLDKQKKEWWFIKI